MRTQLPSVQRGATTPHLSATPTTAPPQRFERDALKNKTGMWWLPAATDAAAGLLPGLSPRDLDLLPPSAAAAGFDSDDDGDQGGGGGGAGGGGGGKGGGAAAELLRLAAAQRMNTDVRKVSGWVCGWCDLPLFGAFCCLWLLLVVGCAVHVACLISRLAPFSTAPNSNSNPKPHQHTAQNALQTRPPSTAMTHTYIHIYTHTHIRPPSSRSWGPRTAPRRPRSCCGCRCGCAATATATGSVVAFLCYPPLLC